MIVREAAPASIIPRLDEGVVHIRSLWLDQEPQVSAALERFLSADERARAARFMFERDRRHFIVCRGALRAALGEYLDMDPPAVRFTYGRRGKPDLAEDSGLAFNVSHAAGLALLAFARTGPIGVDVESVNRRIEAEELATRFFSEDEAKDLLTVPLPQRAEAFFNCWTRKESYIKAIGDGLTVPLDSFSVTLVPGQPAAMRWIAGDDAHRWRIAAFAPAPGFVAAVSTSWVPESVNISFQAGPALVSKR